MKTNLTRVLAIFLFLGVLFTAAASGKGEKAGESARKAEAQKVTLINYMGEQTKINGLKLLCDSVTAKYPKVTFEIETVTYAQYTGILKTRIAADDAPDLFTGWPLQYVELVNSGQVMDLSGKAPIKRLLPWLTQECTVDGKVYGFPLDVQIYGAFYNKDVFDKYGLKVPATIDEFVKVCDTFMANKVYPLVRSYKNSNYPWVEYTTIAYPMLLQDGSTKNVLWKSIVDKKAAFADYPLVAEGLRLYDKLLKYTEPGDMGIDDAQGIVKLAKGERAMYLNGAWMTGDLYAANPKGRFGFFPMPWSNDASRNQSPVGLDDVFMTYTKTKHMEGVDRFFEVAASDEGAKIWMGTAKMMSSVSGAPIPSDNDVQQDIGKVLTSGRQIARSLLIDLAGEYRKKMRANLQLFAMTAQDQRNVDAFLKNLDAEFALIK